MMKKHHMDPPPRHDGKKIGYKIVQVVPQICIPSLLEMQMT